MPRRRSTPRPPPPRHQGRASPLLQHATEPFLTHVSMTPDAFLAKRMLLPPEQRQETAAVVIDALRATTTLLAVLASGSPGVHVSPTPKHTPCALQPPFGDPLEWVYGGEQNGRRIEGGVIGNSPLEVRRHLFAGRFLKFFSSNGGQALQEVAESGFAAVYLACFPNIAATVAELVARRYRRVWFICSGFHETVNLEDVVCAGRGVEHLLHDHGMPMDMLDDEARLAECAARCHADDHALADELHIGHAGSLLGEIGHGSDIEAAITGRGMEAELWEPMRNTLVVQERRGLHPVFVAAVGLQPPRPLMDASRWR